MVMVKNFFQMEIPIQGNILMEDPMVKVNINGLMVQYIKEN